jgi:hypothetical protein
VVSGNEVALLEENRWCRMYSEGRAVPQPSLNFAVSFRVGNWRINITSMIS